MVKTVEEILKDLEQKEWRPDYVRICYYDPERRSRGHTETFPYTIALNKLEAMRRHNPKREYWLEEPDDDGAKVIA